MADEEPMAVSGMGLGDTLSVSLTNKDGQTVVYVDKAAAARGDIPPDFDLSQTLPPAPARPSDSAPKAKWVDYVVGQGMSRTWAEQYTKTALVEWANGEPLPPLEE